VVIVIPIEKSLGELLAYTQVKIYFILV